MPPTRSCASAYSAAVAARAGPLLSKTELRECLAIESRVGEGFRRHGQRAWPARRRRPSWCARARCSRPSWKRWIAPMSRRSRRTSPAPRRATRRSKPLGPQRRLQRPVGALLMRIVQPSASAATIDVSTGATSGDPQGEVMPASPKLHFSLGGRVPPRRRHRARLGQILPASRSPRPVHRLSWRQHADAARLVLFNADAGLFEPLRLAPVFALGFGYDLAVALWWCLPLVLLALVSGRH